MVDGDLFTEKTDEQSCRRIFAVRVAANIFGVGGVVEKRVLTDLEQNYATSANFIARYVKELS